jgi:peptidoglycan/LPS O-acetylase OafA/YrhL
MKKLSSVTERRGTVQTRRDDIQGLRAIAAFAVVIFHTSHLLPGGFLGVDIFFVISGFIVTQLARTEIAAKGRFSISNFVRRRLVRVVPPMAVVVLATLTIFLLVDTPSYMIRSLPLTGIGSLTSVINVYFVWSATDYFQTFQSNPLLHLWSLAVEIHFYLLFAVILKLALTATPRFPSGKGLVAATLLAAGLTAISLTAALTIWLWSGAIGISLPDVFSFFTLPTRIWEFGFGILANLAQSPIGRWKAKALAIHSLQIVSVLLIFAGFKFGSNVWLVPGYQAVAPCFGTALLIATGTRGVVCRALSRPWLTYFGDRSYSIYLWQGPLIGFAAILFATPLSIALAAAGSIAVAIVSYRIVEPMFRNQKRRFDLAIRVPFGAAWLGAILVCLALYFIVPATVGRLEAAAPLRATFLDTNCARQRGTLGIAPCVYGENGAPKILLIGDSHAGAISQAVIDAARRVGWQAHIATASACSVPEYPEDVAYRPSCAGYTANVLSYAREQQVELVILQQFSEYYVTDLRIGLNRWKEGLSEFVSQLAESQIHTLVIGNNLQLPLISGRPFWTKFWALDLSSEIRDRRTLDDVERLAATVRPSGRYLLSRDYLCRLSQCPVFEGGAWQYTDADHLSYKGAQRLIDPIERELRAIAPPSMGGQ